MNYEENVKTEDTLHQLYEGIRAEMTIQEVEFADNRFEELKTLISDDSEYVGECVTELRTHLEAIKAAI